MDPDSWAVIVEKIFIIVVFVVVLPLLGLMLLWALAFWVKSLWSLLRTGETLWARERRERQEQAESEKRIKRQALAEQNALREEYERALNENQDLLNAFRNVVSCVNLMDELIRASKAIHGGLISATAAEILDTDIQDVICAISAATGNVSKADGHLYRSLLTIVTPTTESSFEKCFSSLKWRETRASRLPITVAILHAYDKHEKTQHATHAATAFVALLNSLSKTRGESIGLTMARSCYVALLNPYLRQGEWIAGVSNGAVNRCIECAKFYQVLGLTHDATKAEVKSSYRFLVKKLHPDTSQPQDDGQLHVAETKTKELTEAYDHIIGEGHFTENQA